MELLEELETPHLDNSKLTSLLTIKNLPKLCNSIETILSNDISEGVIYCIWGKHRINRKILKDGVQFSFQECPHALAFSITTKNDGNNILIRCSTDTNIQDEDFMESIKEFIDSWVTGIKKQLNL